MNKIEHEFKLQCISAIQIRLGGAKGILMRSPQTDLDPDDNCVSLRKSQIKFESKDTNLDICKFA